MGRARRGVSHFRRQKAETGVSSFAWAPDARSIAFVAVDPKTMMRSRPNRKSAIPSCSIATTSTDTFTSVRSKATVKRATRDALRRASSTSSPSTGHRMALRSSSLTGRIRRSAVASCTATSHSSMWRPARSALSSRAEAWIRIPISRPTADGLHSCRVAIAPSPWGSTTAFDDGARTTALHAANAIIP